MPSLSQIQQQLSAILHWFVAQFHAVPWGNVRDYWLVYVFDDRMLVAWFLPLVPLLFFAPRAHRKTAIVVSGLLFIAYVWGVFHACLWIATCYAFFRLSEAFAVECRRTDVNPLGPPLVAGTIIVAAHFAFFNMHRWIVLPSAAEAWLHANLPWLYPFAARGFSWEPAELPGLDPKRLFDLYFPYFAHAAGTAYLIVRMTHYFAEIRKGTIRAEERSFARFLAWLCYAPNFMQGPIERYPEFQTQLERWQDQRSLAGALYGVWRIAMGIAKSLFCAIWLEPHIARALYIGPYYTQPELIESNAFLYFGVFLQIFGLYLQFSGYCDISAGIAWIIGYRQIENFAMPWFATSLRDFWRRWHISLSSILRDYVYIPLGGSRTGVPIINLMLTFGICGVWHAYLPQMWWWGVLMGAMLWINQLWHDRMTRLDKLDLSSATGPAAIAARVRRGWLRCRPLPQVFAWLLTQHAFVFSLVLFFGGMRGYRVIIEIFRRAAAQFQG